jgi:hypothetical protein
MCLQLEPSNKVFVLCENNMAFEKDIKPGSCGQKRHQTRQLWRASHEAYLEPAAQHVTIESGALHLKQKQSGGNQLKHMALMKKTIYTRRIWLVQVARFTSTLGLGIKSKKSGGKQLECSHETSVAYIHTR